MTTAAVTYYRENVTAVRAPGTATPAVNAGNQVTITTDIPTATSAMIRQSTLIESQVGYAVTMRKRTVTAYVNTPHLPSVVGVAIVWSADPLVWSGEALEWT